MNGILSIILLTAIGFLSKEAEAGTVVQVKNSSQTAVVRKLSTEPGFRQGNTICFYKGFSIKTCGQVKGKVRGTSKVLVKVRHPRKVRRGYLAKGLTSYQRNMISCNGAVRIQRIIRANSFVTINRGRQCGLRSGQRLCFYGNNRKQACGRIAKTSAYKSMVKVNSNRIRLLEAGYVARTENNQNIQSIQRQSQQRQFQSGSQQVVRKGNKGDFGEKFFSINRGMASVLKEEKNSFDTKPYYLGGYIKEDFAYAYEKEDKELTKIKTTLNLGLDLNFSPKLKGRFEVNYWYDHIYAHKGEENYSKETLDAYQRDLDLRDGYIEGEFTPKLKFKVGRQIVAWGESEFSQISDIVNPRDQLELGLVDVEDSRLAVTASKFTLTKGSLETNLVTVHEMRPNRIAPRGSDFDPLGPIRDIVEFGPRRIPENSIDNTELFLRFSKVFNGGQMALVLGDHFDDEANPAISEFNSDGEVSVVTVNEEYERIQTVAISGNYALDDVLLKGETSLSKGRYLQRNDLLVQINDDPSGESLIISEGKDTVRAMLGTEYSGIQDLTFVFEATNERILDYSEDLVQNHDEGRLNTLASYDMLKGDLEFTASWTHLSRGNGEVYRGTMGYKIKENIEVGAGAIDYDFDAGEGSTLGVYNDQDRAFVNLKMSF